MNDPNPASPSSLTVSSPDLPAGTIPREFTCDGANRRPRLQWSTPPAGTQELAIEMLDPDAPRGHLHPLAGTLSRRAERVALRANVDRICQ